MTLIIRYSRNYFLESSQVVDTEVPPADEVAAYPSQASSASFFVALKEYSAEAETPPPLEVHLQFQSRLQEARDIVTTAKAASIKNFFIFIK